MKFFDKFLLVWIFITTIFYIFAFGVNLNEKKDFLDTLMIALVLWFLTNIIPLLIIRYRLKNYLLLSFEITDWFKLLLLPSERKARSLEREKLAKKEERAKKRRLKKNKIERENKAKAKQALIDSIPN